MNIAPQYIGFAKEFKIPLLIVGGIILFLFFAYVIPVPLLSTVIILLAIGLGTYELFKETVIGLMKGQYALDYIAILAIIVAVITQEYLVAAILSLMISSGRTLEEYGVSRARQSLTGLIERIPDEVLLWTKGAIGDKKKIRSIKIGEELYVRKGEVIPLDGILVSENGLTDESSLTGEPYFIDKIKGDALRSGTINLGDPIIIRVTKTQKNSTYNKIIEMVQHAQEEKSPLVRLADTYSTYFTIITLVIAAFAYVYSHFNLTSVLAVLAVATPCPLIIATPIALLGGVNASAKKKIIVKQLASLEVLSRVTALIFDKTGTITIGKPRLTKVELKTDKISEDELLGIAEAIERSSLHPLAKAIVNYAKEKNAPVVAAEHITEKIGEGITGEVLGKQYTLAKLSGGNGMAIELRSHAQQLVVFRFEDEIKQDSKEIIQYLKDKKLSLFIFTGDKKESAEKVAEQLGGKVTVKAELTPEDKQKGIEELKKKGIITAMVGDGINDAPALALADVGMVFSNEEQTAASEAADIVFLGGNFSQVLDAYGIAKRTIQIAMQSILWGIGLSIVAMVFAAVGVIPPLFGAGIQEAIDVAVILNALRASR